MEHLMSSAPHMVDVLTIGKSSEGRPLKVVKVSTGKEMGKPAIWIDGGMHGREWIAPAVALYILKQLVENQLNSNISIIQKLDWYIMPVVNPDGYEYTHVTDRFWRKSRSKTQDAEFEENRMFWDSARECAGVDLNRNWDFHWGEVGSSDNPCSPNYSGLRPFSEPETRAVSDFILDKRDQLKAYITLHSYSQMWLIPWGFTKQKVADYEDLLYLGKKAIESLSKVHGTKYTIGTSPALLYPTSGSSDDWAKGKAGIQYSYTVELRDRGTYGFLLPATQIVPTGRETFAGVRTLAKSLINNRELKKSHQGRRRPRIGVQWQQLSDS
ncbi:hypothetical protein AAG570_004003 [Ranatra chinensis]|uniref:Peptidase M14 domain-containing protein n=1 Tax=Ranatra chinensis TaxID=642074 RepID=A0ABD0YH23_9HEMI